MTSLIINFVGLQRNVAHLSVIAAVSGYFRSNLSISALIFVVAKVEFKLQRKALIQNVQTAVYHLTLLVTVKRDQMFENEAQQELWMGKKKKPCLFCNSRTWSQSWACSRQTALTTFCIHLFSVIWIHFHRFSSLHFVLEAVLSIT